MQMVVSLGHPFDAKQGWGRMDIEAVLVPEVNVLSWDQAAVFGDTGETWATRVVAVDPAKPVRIMLVWTDAPGHGLGGMTPSMEQRSRPRGGGQRSGLPGQLFESAHRLECARMGRPTAGITQRGVFLTPGSVDECVVRIVASNITSDGIPGVGDATDQDFALICYNCGTTLLFGDDFESGGYLCLVRDGAIMKLSAISYQLSALSRQPTCLWRPSVTMRGGSPALQNTVPARSPASIFLCLFAPVFSLLQAPY